MNNNKKKIKESSIIKEKRSLFSRIFSFVYFLMLLTAIVVVSVGLQRSQNHTSIAGFSVFNIRTASMHSEIPKGSLILTRAFEPNEYIIGDDVTYYDIAKTKSMVTHRIISIDNSDRNNLQFETQGVDNEMPDEFLVPSGNIVGKVIFVVPMVGLYLSYIQENILLSIGFCVLILLTIKSLQSYLALRKENNTIEKNEDISEEGVLVEE